MKVVFTFLSNWNHLVATELELLEKHINAGDEVSILTCLGEPPSCVYNPENDARKCNRCVLARFESLGALSEAVKIESLNSYLLAQDRNDSESVRVPFSSVTEAQELQSEDLDIGFAALSSTIHVYRDSAIDNDNSRRAWSELLVTSFLSYRATINYIRSKGADRFYLFNGRFAITRGVLRACQGEKIDVKVFERGSSKDKYAIFDNHLPHDRNKFLENLNGHWAIADPSDRERIGSDFFESRRSGNSDLWISFTQQQTQGKMPQSWDPSKRNVVIFNSSEDEFVGIGKEWQNPIYKSQGAAIEKIVGELRDSDIKFYLRMHPNLAKVDNEDTRRILSLNGKGLEIIPADSPVSTYDLMLQAEKVLTFGSSAGIEATYWGVPSILAGLCFYRELDAAHVADNHEKVIDLILQKDLSVKPKINAIRFGYYLRTFGIDTRQPAFSKDASKEDRSTRVGVHLMHCFRIWLNQSVKKDLRLCE
jgi:hypothetical protein